MKKISILFALVFVLGLFGCTPAEDSNNGDQDLQDNQINDSTIVDDPVIPDIVVVNEKDKFADMYVKDLYDGIIAKAAFAEIAGGLFHSSEFKNSSMLDVNDMMRVAYCIDRDIHVHRVYNEDYGYCYDRADLRETINRVFGIKAKIATEEWSAGGLAFMYFGKGDFFGGEPAYGGDFPIEKIFGYFGKYELDGDYLCIYDRVLFCDHDRWGTGIIKFYSDINKTEESYVNEFQVVCWECSN